MAVYNSNMAPIGVKFWKNTFHPIPDIAFFEPKTFWGRFFQNFLPQFFVQESCVLEELGIIERHWQIPRRTSLPIVRLFFLYDPWRRGKSGTVLFCSWLNSAKNDFHSKPWWLYYNRMMLWWKNLNHHEFGGRPPLNLDHYFSDPEKCLRPIVGQQSGGGGGEGGKESRRRVT